MPASVGQLVAFLTVDSTGWNTGLAKARREMQASAREIDRTLKEDFGKNAGGIDWLRKAFGSSGGDKLAADALAVRQSYQKQSLDIGQGMGGLQTGEISRATRDVAAGLGAAKVSLSSILSMVAAVGTAMRGTVVLAKAWSNELEGVRQGYTKTADRVSESLKVVPVVGDIVSDFVDYGSGRDIRKQTYETQKAERNARAEAYGERARYARAMSLRIAEIEGQTRVERYRGIGKELAAINEGMRRDLAASEFSFRESGSYKGVEQIRAHEAEKQAIRDSYRAKELSALREFNHAADLAARQSRTTIEVLDAKLTLGDRESALLATQLQYRERILAAEWDGQFAVAAQLRTEESRVLAEQRRLQGLERYRERAGVSTEIGSKVLGMMGMGQQAEALQWQHEMDARIRDARERLKGQEQEDMVQRLKTLRTVGAEAIMTQGTAGQLSQWQTAGPSVMGGGGQIGSAIRGLGNSIRIDGFDQQLAAMDRLIAAVERGVFATAAP
jgi:hypothetical protein